MDNISERSRMRVQRRLKEENKQLSQELRRWKESQLESDRIREIENQFRLTVASPPVINAMGRSPMMTGIAETDRTVHGDYLLQPLQE